MPSIHAYPKDTQEPQGGAEAPEEDVGPFRHG